MGSNVVNLDERSSHAAIHYACMACAHDWNAAFPPTPDLSLECPQCHAPAGEPVALDDWDWFTRFMTGPNHDKRTLVLLNAARQARKNNPRT